MSCASSSRHPLPPFGTQGGGPYPSTGPHFGLKAAGLGLDPRPPPPPLQSARHPLPSFWALTCDGEDAEEDGHQRLDADAHLGGHLLAQGELAMLVALAHGHVQHAGAREAWPPVVRDEHGQLVDLGALPVKIPVLDYDAGRVIWKHQGLGVRRCCLECPFSRHHRQWGPPPPGSPRNCTSSYAAWAMCLPFIPLPCVLAVVGRSVPPERGCFGQLLRFGL